MKQCKIERGHGLSVIAAAVVFALGSSYATAQQAGQPGADRPETQQSQREDPLSSDRQQDSASQRAGEAASELESETRSAAADTEGESGSGQLDQIAQEHDDLSTFIEAVKAAGMEESLTSGTEYTVFAPTNDAWEEMSGLSTEELMSPENREQLISLLRAHIVADDVDENMARTLQQAQTIDGGTVSLSSSGDELQVGDATVVESGIQQGSLRIYAIDQVLEPTALARAEPGSQSESGSESESELDTESDIGSEREGGSPLGTESERESQSPLDTQSEREPGSPLDREDPFGSDSPGADRPGASPDRSGSQSERDRTGLPN
ncbi:MAG TPA: fasciclin domain-containing protein [Steroidobacter sp.]